MAKIITVEIDENTGDFAIDLTGFQGRGCADIIKAFAEVGQVTEELHKTEYNQQAKQNTVKVGQ